jgi:hypothetical protein
MTMRISTSKLASLGALGSIPFAVLACVVDSQQSGGGSASGGGSGWVGSTGTSGVDGGGAPSAYPMTVTLDTNQTMTAQPGQGVGVFFTYTSGGNWTAWWTCDSSVDSANPPCAFDVKITAQTGSVSSVLTQGFQATDALQTVSPSTIEATTTTTTGTSGVTFATDPGAKILVSATLAGQYDGRFIFFVEGGQIRDNFQGTLTDPIYMTASTP